MADDVTTEETEAPEVTEVTEVTEETQTTDVQEAHTEAAEPDMESVTVTDGPYALFVADFADEDAAWEAYEQLKEVDDETSLRVESVLVLKRSLSGELEIQKVTDPSTRRGLGWGVVGGVVLGIMFPPSILGSAVVLGAAGAGIGKAREVHHRNELADELADAIDPGHSGLVALVSDPAAVKVQEALAKADRIVEKAVDRGPGRRHQGRGEGRRSPTGSPHRPKRSSRQRKQLRSPRPEPTSSRKAPHRDHLWGAFRAHDAGMAPLRTRGRCPEVVGPDQLAGVDPQVTHQPQEAPAVRATGRCPCSSTAVIAAPQEGGPYPVAVILHGMHPGCPVDANGVDSWPCDPADEQPNHAGFAWLAEELAARGMVALALNLNARVHPRLRRDHPRRSPRAAGRPAPSALGDASAGGDADFGIDLTGRADTSQLLLVGHSRGGESAVTLATDWAAAPDGEQPYGPAAGLLLLAPAVVFSAPDGVLPAPTAIVLPSCDADVRAQDGMGYLESARLVDNDTWVTAAWLDGANHNNVNTTLAADAFALEGRPDCEPGLSPSTQREVTGAYAADFATVAVRRRPPAGRGRPGPDGHRPRRPCTDHAVRYPGPGRVPAPRRPALAAAHPHRRPSDLSADSGAILVADGLSATLCPAGYYTPYMEPDLVDCHRAQLTVPGDPALALASWSEPGGVLRVALPAVARRPVRVHLPERAHRGRPAVGAQPRGQRPVLHAPPDRCQRRTRQRRCRA